MKMNQKRKEQKPLKLGNNVNEELGEISYISVDGISEVG